VLSPKRGSTYVGLFRGVSAWCGGFAGAEASADFAAPTSPCSSEDRIGFRAQLRPTFARRRRTDYRKPTSDEKGAHRRKAPAPISGGFAGAEASANFSAPTSLRSSEDRIGFRAQLRPAFARRRRTNYRKPTSDEKGAHRRKAALSTFSA